eukprot:1454781-Pleurochrysis_carterae.AAC.1
MTLSCLWRDDPRRPDDDRDISRDPFRGILSSQRSVARVEQGDGGGGDGGAASPSSHLTPHCAHAVCDSNGCSSFYRQSHAGPRCRWLWACGWQHCALAARAQCKGRRSSLSRPRSTQAEQVP